MLYSTILSMIVSCSAAFLAYPSLAEAADGDPYLGCGEAIRAPEGSTVVVPVILHLGNTPAPDGHVVSVYKPGLPNNEYPWVMCMWKNSDELPSPDICNKGSSLSRILDHTYRLMITIPTIKKDDSGNYNVSWTISSNQTRIIKRCVWKLLVEEADGDPYLGCGEAIRAPEGSTVLVPVILHLGNTPAPDGHVVSVYKPGLPNNEHPWVTCMWTNEDELHVPDICNEGSRLSRILTHMYRLMIRIPTVRKEDSGNYIVSWRMSPDPDKITKTCVITLLVQEDIPSTTTRQCPILLGSGSESGVREEESCVVSIVATCVITIVATACVLIAIGWRLFRTKRERQRR